jgi:hypothetical protein
MPAQEGPAEATVTAIVVVAEMAEFSVEVAVMVAVSAPVVAGLNVTPVPEATLVEVLNDPSAAGLTARLTVSVKAPLPVTVGVQVEVCSVVMDVGEQTSVTPVTAGAPAVMAILAEPEMVVNPAAAECAVQVAVPAAEGVKTPPVVMVPPVAVHVTAVL